MNCDVHYCTYVLSQHKPWSKEAANWFKVFISFYCIAEPHKRVSMTTFGSRLKIQALALTHRKDRFRWLTVFVGQDNPGIFSSSRGGTPLRKTRGGKWRTLQKRLQLFACRWGHYMQSECGQRHAVSQKMEDHGYGFAGRIELPRAIHRFGMKWAGCKQSSSHKSQLRRWNFGHRQRSSNIYPTSRSHEDVMREV